MLTRIGLLISVVGLAVLFYGVSQSIDVLFAIGIGMMIVGVIATAMGINRRKQTGNRILYLILGIIVAVAFIFGLMGEF